jgi:hypothetical protein
MRSIIVWLVIVLCLAGVWLAVVKTTTNKAAGAAAPVLVCSATVGQLPGSDRTHGYC